MDSNTGYNGTYIGRVVYNDDPTYTGRCKIMVFGLFDSMDTEEMPWFTPVSSSVYSSVGGGSLSVPKIGTIVRVKFQNGDIYSGEYYSAQIMDPGLADEIRDDYQGTHVLLYDSEKDLIVLYQPMTGFKIYLNGSIIKVDADGSIQLKHRNNTSVVEVNDTDINVTCTNNGNVNINAGSTVTVNAPTVNVEADGVNIGKNAASSAVKGEKLVAALKQIVTELNTKFPVGASTLAGKSFSEILSTDVKIS